MCFEMKNILKKQPLYIPKHTSDHPQTHISWVTEPESEPDLSQTTKFDHP
jgi:hypothetical protein